MIHVIRFIPKIITFQILEKMEGIHENQQMGAFYLLSALTLVSPPAATAMPWLYESVVHTA